MGNALRLAIVRVGLLFNRWDVRTSEFKSSKQHISILIVGLDKSGKTTIAKRIFDNNDRDLPDGQTYTQTKGFSTRLVRKRNLTIHLNDLGGHESIQELWAHYYPDSHGVIFVVDSSATDPQIWSRCALTFEELLSNKLIIRKPILVLANKQDLEDAVSEEEVAEKLNMEKIVNKAKCQTRLDVCSAVAPKKGQGKGIFKGFEWLIKHIRKNYKEINERVQQDYEEERVRERTLFNERSAIFARETETETDEVAVGSSTEDLFLKDVPEIYDFSTNDKLEQIEEGQRSIRPSPEGADFNENSPSPSKTNISKPSASAEGIPKIEVYSSSVNILDRGAKSRMRISSPPSTQLGSRREKSNPILDVESQLSSAAHSQAQAQSDQSVQIGTTKAQIHRRNKVRDQEVQDESLNELKIVYSKANTFLARNDSSEDLTNTESDGRPPQRGLLNNLRRNNRTAPQQTILETSEGEKSSSSSTKTEKNVLVAD